jgi:hypothetical protein
VVHHRFTLAIPEPTKREASLALPPFPRFQDPYALPERSLERERRLAYNREGRPRLVAQTHLAARLWSLANRKIDRIRRLQTRARRRGRRPPQARIARLRRDAAAHLKECVALLEGVLERRAAPRMARVRLAHYLREMKPRRAIPHFRALVRSETDADRRKAYTRDLAQLLLGAGRPAQALRVLARYAPKRPTLRTRLIRVVARVRARHRPVSMEADLRSLARSCERAPAALRRAFLRSVPGLMAGLAAPQRLLVGLARHAPACWRRQRVKLSEGGIRQLMLQGRPTAAAKVLRAVKKRGVTVPAALAKRVLRLGGPWSPRPAPPTAERFERLLQVRAAALRPCLGSTRGGRPRLSMRVGPRGRARFIDSPRVASRPPRKKSIARGPARLRAGCARAVVGAWRFPSWRGAREVKLHLRLQPGPAAVHRAAPRAPR